MSKYALIFMAMSVYSAANYTQAHAQATQLITPIIEKNMQGVQKIDLTLPLTAMYLQHPNQISVVGANRQVMPMRVSLAQKPPVKAQIGLQIYRWPQAAVLNDSAAIGQLQLQLKQGEQQATVNWPGQPNLSLQQKGMDQVWLLASKTLPLALQDKSLQGQSFEPKSLVLNWPDQDFSSQVELEGSNDLKDWQFVGNGQVLQAHDGQGGKLRQQHIEVQDYYAYWRLRFDHPIALQDAYLQVGVPETPQWQQQSFVLQPLKDSPQQWQLKVPHAIAIQKMQFDVPLNQLWRVTVMARLTEQGRQVWQQVGQTELYRREKDSAQTQADANQSNLNQIDFNQTINASEWRVQLEAPVSPTHLPIQVFAPKTELYFLAQGSAPYQVIYDPSMTRIPPQLPQRIKQSSAAHLGETTAKLIPVSSRQYGLWIGLLLLVGVLGVAAWRLFATMERSDDPT